MACSNIVYWVDHFLSMCICLWMRGIFVLRYYALVSATWRFSWVASWSATASVAGSAWVNATASVSGSAWVNATLRRSGCFDDVRATDRISSRACFKAVASKSSRLSVSWSFGSALVTAARRGFTFDVLKAALSTSGSTSSSAVARSWFLTFLVTASWSRVVSPLVNRRARSSGAAPLVKAVWSRLASASSSAVWRSRFLRFPEMTAASPIKVKNSVCFVFFNYIQTQETGILMSVYR